MTARERIRHTAIGYLGKTVQITIDRPLGSTHPKHRDIVYPINYGFIEHTTGGDGEEIDVYLLGVDVPVKSYSAVIAGVVCREDDDEDKLIAAPNGISFTADEMYRAVEFQEKYFDSHIEVLK
nr:inorganic diphosphatase [Clostridia bacterium]